MKKLLYFPMLMLLFLTSCDLDLSPKDKVDVENFWNTATDLQLFTNYFYDNLLTQSMTSDNQCFEVQDDCKVGQNLSAVLKGGTYRDVPASGGGWSWGVLRRINTFLEYADRCEDKEAVRKYTGVARFFRAYFYFEKVKRFGDVPWIDRQLGSADEGLYNPRDSREFIMQKMLEDVDFAIEALPAKEKETSAPYRLTSGAALALKAQFCLFEGTFRKYHNIQIEGAKPYTFYLEQCVDACEKLMSGKYGSYKLFSTGKPDSDYMNLFAAQDANKDEYILAVKYDQSMKILHNANAHTIVATQGQPGYTRKFVCSYLMKDGTRFTNQPNWQTMTFVEEVKNRDPRLAQSIRTLNYKRIGGKDVLAVDFTCTTTGYQPIKFVTESMSGSINMDKNVMSSNDLPQYRYAEVLLNYAEAKAELGQLTQDDLDKSVNLLRKRVGMTGMMNMADANANPDPYLMADAGADSKTATGYYNVSGANTGVILEIRRERAVELVQEGFRWYDLMRWKCGKCIDQPFTGQYIPGPGSYDLTGDGVPDVIFYAKDTAKPATPNNEKVYELGVQIKLTDGNKGYINYYETQPRNGFNEGRDYFYPIPLDDLNLNPNLVQNPGWVSGK